MRKVILVITVLGFIIDYSNSQGWEVLNSGVTVDLFGINFINYNTGYVCGASGTLIKTTNAGLNWYSSNNGLASILYDIYFINEQTGYCCGATGIFKTINSGLNWVSVFSGFQINEIFCVNSSLIYAGGQTGVFKSTNEGLSWSNVMPGYTGSISGLHFLDENTGYAMGTISATRKTTNGGATWTGGLPWYPGDFNFKECYFFNSGSGFVLYYAVYPPPNYSQSTGIYNAVAMNSFYLVWNVSNRVLNGLTFKGNDTAYAVGGGWNGAAYESIILRSVNGGNNWSALVSNMISQILNDVFFVDAKYGFAVGKVGVIIKTQTAGVLSINPISSEIPKSFSLSQNYPNPFNPSTTIRFSIPLLSTTPLGRGVSAESGRGVLTSLYIFNSLGQKIATLVYQQLSPGAYEVEWNAANYPSGLYFYKLTSGDYTDTKRMILIK